MENVELYTKQNVTCDVCGLNQRFFFGASVGLSGWGDAAKRKKMLILLYTGTSDK